MDDWGCLAWRDWKKNGVLEDWSSRRIVSGVSWQRFLFFFMTRVRRLAPDIGVWFSTSCCEVFWTASRRFWWRPQLQGWNYWYGNFQHPYFRIYRPVGFGSVATWFLERISEASGFENPVFHTDLDKNAACNGRNCGREALNWDVLSVTKVISFTLAGVWNLEVWSPDCSRGKDKGEKSDFTRLFGEVFWRSPTSISTGSVDKRCMHAWMIWWASAR